ncbi:hypothetical protein EL22_11415 [Halostagnicola sp. A56]|uniref:hypothetical protein n=1 Tax=Halostagnicola sp. A56 TaxID=1495067 RepID=UPI0004A02B20|nr:hypothetical protein [Halostagnicola sp. A56]KDE57544.1 hypothetical protein EL22_11415 [Halostagnicola sp. A56]
MTREEELTADIVEKLARKKVTGNSKRQVDTVKNWFASSDQGQVEDLLRELARDPESPVEMYGGGGRDNVRLTSLMDAKDWLSDHKRDLWWL